MIYILPILSELTDSLIGKCVQKNTLRIAKIDGQIKAFLTFEPEARNDIELKKFKQYTRKQLNPILNKLATEDAKELNL